MVIITRMIRTNPIVNIFGFFLTLTSWVYILSQQFRSIIDILIVLSGPIFFVLFSLTGRLALNYFPKYVNPINSIVHYSIMITMGSAILKAISSAKIKIWNAYLLPRSLSVFLILLFGLLTLITVLNLVIKGFGAPFAIVSSRRIAHEWLYERTRNPMVLVLILFLISFGFFFNSLFIIFWTLLLV
ncbi:MAG: hypothetical protein ACXAC2_08875, partial [Candidatus Kariarchaeaceae archaeon]